MARRRLRFVSVDDMTHFALLYLDPQGTWSAARALAEAQRCLREDATRDVLASDDLVALMPAHMRNLYTIQQIEHIQHAAEQPYATADDPPIYWAAFIFTGWEELLFMSREREPSRRKAKGEEIVQRRDPGSG